MGISCLRHTIVGLIAAFTVSGVVGCGSNTSAPVASSVDTTIEFSDEVESNREDDGSLNGLEFVDTNGNRVALADFLDKKNVLLVFMRGFYGTLCPFCTAQTSRLISNHSEFLDRNAEVLLVYPGARDQIMNFKQASLELSGEDQFPFPVLLDEDLAVVKKLGIESVLAFPSTFIIDQKGRVRFSYVGKSSGDRPSIKVMLDQLDALVNETKVSE